METLSRGDGNINFTCVQIPEQKQILLVSMYCVISSKRGHPQKIVSFGPKNKGFTICIILLKRLLQNLQNLIFPPLPTQGNISPTVIKYGTFSRPTKNLQPGLTLIFTGRRIFLWMPPHPPELNELFIVAIPNTKVLLFQPCHSKIIIYINCHSQQKEEKKTQKKNKEQNHPLNFLSKLYCFAQVDGTIIFLFITVRPL